MDRIRSKSKKDSPTKYVEKEKSSLFITDMKSMKENLKIKEILRTVKMNSSMRIKAPRGSKIMQNKDFNDNDEFDEVQHNEELDGVEPASATNAELVGSAGARPECASETLNENCINDFVESVNNADSNETISGDKPGDVTDNDENVGTSKQDINNLPLETIQINIEAPSEDQSGEQLENVPNASAQDLAPSDIESKPPIEIPTVQMPIERPLKQTRERKLSLDQTMLNRRESISQSEIDLYLIGKSPLERKSSFFRKKMESFFKNTTEIFKRQSLAVNKSQLSRRGSMSVSLQSLNETTNGGDVAEALHRDRVSVNMSSIA